LHSASLRCSSLIASNGLKRMSAIRVDHDGVIAGVILSNYGKLHVFDRFAKCKPDFSGK
jgi:hypothetical protein